jgi:hypothetical protein
VVVHVIQVVDPNLDHGFLSLQTGSSHNNGRQSGG